MFLKIHESKLFFGVLVASKGNSNWQKKCWWCLKLLWFGNLWLQLEINFTVILDLLYGQFLTFFGRVKCETKSVRWFIWRRQRSNFQLTRATQPSRCKMSSASFFRVSVVIQWFWWFSSIRLGGIIFFWSADVFGKNVSGFTPLAVENVFPQNSSFCRPFLQSLSCKILQRLTNV